MPVSTVNIFICNYKIDYMLNENNIYYIWKLFSLFSYIAWEI